MQRIVMFKGLFQYDVVNVFVDALADAFRERGWEPVVVNAANIAEVQAAFENNVHAAFGFNGSL